MIAPDYHAKLTVPSFPISQTDNPRVLPQTLDGTRIETTCPPKPSHGTGWVPPGARVFGAGFGLSLLILMIEYLTAGEFPGWLILVPSNPTTLLAALAGHRVEAAVGAQWADEAYFVTLGVESALWWFVVGALVAAVRRYTRSF